jgi:hypothetical protein
MDPVCRERELKFWTQSLVDLATQYAIAFLRHDWPEQSTNVASACERVFSAFYGASVCQRCLIVPKFRPGRIQLRIQVSVHNEDRRRFCNESLALDRRNETRRATRKGNA